MTTVDRRDLTAWERVRLFPLVHEAWSLTRVAGLRDRLRCPDCRRVGTWKPHGGVVDALVDWKDLRTGRMDHGLYRRLRTTRRWLCKWCGHYTGPEGAMRGWPSPVEGCWVLGIDEDEPPGLTPEDAVAEMLGSVNPWRG
jgi:hypothetical protein